MTTFKADYNNNNIVLSNDNRTIASIPITSLLLNNGENAVNANNFEKHQQQVNYLDSVKDGANVWMLQGLEIYPRAAEDGYPTFPGTLKDFENQILERRKDYLTHTTWLKVKKGSVLDPGKNYNQCLWESGLGYEVFLADPDNVETIKTFGSFIDPLEKQNAKSVWPEIGSSVELTTSFMKIMGFGEYSSLVAKTTTGNAFEYTMNIGCGNACNSKRDACQLIQNKNNIRTNDNNKYFAGNNEKKQFLKTNASSEEKIKFIVIKEWGDKVQVLIYLIYYHIIKSEYSVIMTTCDMVVFMLCLNLAIPCIYTGAYKPPRLNLDPNKKYYSVLEYKPSDNPYRDAFIRLARKIKAIAEENESFIKAVYSLVENPDTPIRVNDEEYYFSEKFYQALHKDINFKNIESTEYGNTIIEKYEANNNINLIPELEEELKAFERNYLLVPFLKIKKGTTKKLTMLMTKSYTAQKKPCNNNKPAIAVLLNEMKYAGNTEKESQKTFLELALKYFQNGGGVQRGGALSGEEISLFPQDEDNPEVYNYVTNEEIENDSEVYNVHDPDAVFNPEINPDKEQHNLLHILEITFDSIMRDRMNHILKDPKYYSLFKDCYENFKDTIYTLFVYDSYLDGVTSDIFKIKDYERIVDKYELFEDLDYKLFEDLNEPPLVENEVAKGFFAPGSPSGPSGDYGVFPLSQKQYDLEVVAASPRNIEYSPEHKPNYSSKRKLEDKETSDEETSDEETPDIKRIPSNYKEEEIEIEEVYGGKKRKTRRIIKKRKFKKTRNAKKSKRNKTIKKQRKNKKRKTRK